MIAVAAPLPEGVSTRERAALCWLHRAFGRAATTPRRRRLLFLALAAPGFVGVFATPLHRNPALLLAGALLFAAATLFRARTEPLLVRAEAAGLWPPILKEPPHV